MINKKRLTLSQRVKILGFSPVVKLTVAEKNKLKDNKFLLKYIYVEKDKSFITEKIDNVKLLKSANVTSFKQMLDKYGFSDYRVKKVISDLSDFNRIKNEFGVLYDVKGNRVITQVQAQAMLDKINVDKIIYRKQLDDADVKVAPPVVDEIVVEKEVIDGTKK